VINWSFSSLKEYLNCPKQYYHLKIAKDYTKKVTVEMSYGTEVHKALEDYVRDGTPLVKNYQQYQPALDALLEIPGQKYPEHEMALNADREPCAFDDENRWVRGIVDLLIVDGDKAFIVDYKTGNNKYADSKQLKLMALMAYAHFPSVMNIKAGLLFITRNSFVTEEYARSDISKLWAEFLPSLERLRLAYENSMWPATPSGLCGWCPIDSCKFYRER
jgi:RecB family exonuclease